MNLNFFTKQFLVIFTISASFFLFAADMPERDLFERLTGWTRKVPKLTTQSNPAPLTTPVAAPDALTNQTAAVEKLSNSNLTTQQMALIAAITATTAVTGYGIYTYHKNIKPTKELIDSSIKFLNEILQDPFSFNKQNTGARTFTATKDLNIKKLEMLRALGLTESYFNPQSYINRLVNKSREDVNNLFSEIKKTIAIEETESADLPKTIKVAAVKPYMSLLEAKNTIEAPPAQTDSIIPTDIKQLKTIDQWIMRVCLDENYTVPHDLLKNKAYILNAYTLFKSYIANPLQYNCGATCQPSILLKKGEEVEKAQTNFENEFSGGILNYIATFAESKKTQKNKAKEKEIFNNLFYALKVSIAPATVEPKARMSIETAGKNVKEDAKKCCYLVLKRLNDFDKWAIIQDYINTLYEISPSVASREARMHNSGPAGSLEAELQKELKPAQSSSEDKEEEDTSLA